MGDGRAAGGAGRAGRELNFEALGLPDPAPETLDRLRRYGELLVEVAFPRGLIGFGPARVPEQIARSLALLEVLDAPSSVIDVGSGAGLPGIPLAVALADPHARRSTRVMLLEPKRRAVGFLELAVRELGLLGLEVEVVAEPAENMARGRLRESGDAVVARALAPLPVVAELCAPLTAVRGVVIVTASPGPDSSSSLRHLDQLGLGIPRTVSLSPIPNVEQRVHIMRKIGPTSPLYPRRPGVARRRPLW